MVTKLNLVPKLRLSGLQPLQSWSRQLLQVSVCDALFLASMAVFWLIWWCYSSYMFNLVEPRSPPCTTKMLAHDPNRFAAFNNSLERGEGDAYLVPNLVHFVRMGEGSEEVSDQDAERIRAALRTQPGCLVLLHTDRRDMLGAAWEGLSLEAGGRLRLQRRQPPQHVFGLPIRDNESLHRVTALRVLREYGGVLVSNSAFLLADLAPYRRYECARVADDGDLLVLAHRDARLPARWLHHFHDAAFQWERRPSPPPHLCRTVPMAGTVSDLDPHSKVVPAGESGVG